MDNNNVNVGPCLTISCMVRHSLTDHNSLGNGSIEVTKIGFIGLSTYEPFPSVSGVQQQQVDGVHVYVAVRFRYFLPGSSQLPSERKFAPDPEQLRHFGTSRAVRGRPGCNIPGAILEASKDNCIQTYM